MKSTITTLTLALLFAAPLAAQVAAPADRRADARVETRRRTEVVTPAADASKQQQAPRSVPQKPAAAATRDRLEPDDAGAPPPADIAPELLAGRRGSITEDEAAILPYYNNYLTTYHLGPEDVISVEVFGQPRYSKANITIPPTGRISYLYIKGGLSLVGKTTQQVEDEIKRHYEEIIIEPEVSVTLDKVGSARFSVVGDVAQPGVRLMTHRYSVREAINEAGGVLATGNKKKVTIVRAQGGDRPPLVIVVNLSNIEKGKAPDEYLAANDQILVPGNKLKLIKNVSEIFSLVSFARIFTGGF